MIQNRRIVCIDGHQLGIKRLRGFAPPPAATYIVHGEPPAMGALQAAIARELGTSWRTHAPAYLESVEV